MSEKKSEIGLSRISSGMLDHPRPSALAMRGLGDLRKTESADQLLENAKQLDAAERYQDAFEVLLRVIAIAPDHFEAQCWIGHAYYSGNGIREDKAEAERWYRKSAVGDWAEAQLRLGNSLGDDSPSTERLEEAALWMRRAAERGLWVAQSNFSKMCLRGLGVHKDPTEAEIWALKAVNAVDNDSYAEMVLGEVYDERSSEYCARDDAGRHVTETYMWAYLAALMRRLGGLENGGSGYQILQKLERWLIDEEIETG